MLGKEVVDISVIEVSKGAALQMIRAKMGLDPERGGVLYAGDDVTDEAAFAVLDDSLGDVTIKVGEGQTLARHRLLTPEDVADRLTLLVHLRRFA
jgi:trehalose 6-phosphate phosphatase